MFSLLAFVLNAKFLLGALIGGMVGTFIVPLFWKPKAK